SGFTVASRDGISTRLRAHGSASGSRSCTSVLRGGAQSEIRRGERAGQPAAHTVHRALPSRAGGRYLLRMRMVPVFVNGARVESAERAPVIEAVRQWDAEAAREVESGARSI